MPIKVTNPPSRSEARFNGIFYGLTGVGKTQLLGSAEDCEFTSPMMLIDLDGGLLTLADTDIAVVRPTNFVELQEVYDYLRNDNTKYQSVGIDTLTEQQRGISMGTILGEIDEDLAYNDLSKSTAPTRQDWLKSSVHMRKFIRAFRDLSYLEDTERRLHVFFAAGERTDEVRNIGCPSLPGLLGLECGGYVDVLARLTVTSRETEDNKIEEVRYLYTKEHEDQGGVRYLGKNRLGRLNRRVRNPTIAKLIAQWTAE